MSVVDVVDRVLHCTVHTDHLNYNYIGQVNMHSIYRIGCFWNQKSHPASS